MTWKQSTSGYTFTDDPKNKRQLEDLAEALVGLKQTEAAVNFLVQQVERSVASGEDGTISLSPKQRNWIVAMAQQASLTAPFGFCSVPETEEPEKVENKTAMDRLKDIHDRVGKDPVYQEQMEQAKAKPNKVDNLEKEVSQLQGKLSSLIHIHNNLARDVESRERDRINYQLLNSGDKRMTVNKRLDKLETMLAGIMNDDMNQQYADIVGSGTNDTTEEESK